jgi:hypothetical protein
MSSFSILKLCSAVLGIRALASSLLQNTSLQRLSVFKNAIGNEGALAFADVLTQLSLSPSPSSPSSSSSSTPSSPGSSSSSAHASSLKSLDLDLNGITSEGVVALMNALLLQSSSSSCQLSELSLNNNHIDDAAAEKICEVIKADLPHLLAIHACNCDISDEAVAGLKAALVHNHHLEFVRVGRHTWIEVLRDASNNI